MSSIYFDEGIFPKNTFKRDYGYMSVGFQFGGQGLDLADHFIILVGTPDRYKIEVLPNVTIEGGKLLLPSKAFAIAPIKIDPSMFELKPVEETAPLNDFVSEDPEGGHAAAKSW